MPKFLVTLKEITYQKVIVVAENREEAEDKGYEAQFEPDFGWNGKMTTMVDSIEQIESENLPDLDCTYILQKNNK